MAEFRHPCIGENVWTGIKNLHAVDCRTCGYVHLFPKPSQEEIGKLYRHDYYQTHNAGWFEKEAREQWYWRSIYRRRLEIFKSYLHGIIAHKGAPYLLLDYGSGCGWFVWSAIWDNDWVTGIQGVEPNGAALNYAMKKIGAGWIKEDLCEVKWRGHFCAIHAALVLEHLLDPLGTLKLFSEFLLPGGVLCVVVPKEFNPLQKRLSKRHGYTPFKKCHLNYFTPETLKALAERAGFKVVRETATFPMEWFALHGLNYVRHPRLGTVAHWLRMFVEYAGLSIAPKRWERLRDRWAVRGIGREIELWLRKPKANGS